MIGLLNDNFFLTGLALLISSVHCHYITHSMGTLHDSLTTKYERWTIFFSSSWLLFKGATAFCPLQMISRQACWQDSQEPAVTLPLWLLALPAGDLQLCWMPTESLWSRQNVYPWCCSSCFMTMLHITHNQTVCCPCFLSCWSKDL